MKIVLSSNNKAKVLATKKVFSKLFQEMILKSVVVESGVSQTPTTDDEGIQGALNRIENAKKIVPEADMYIGLEGIITENTFGTFICGWAVVDLVKEHRKGIGCSAKVQLPASIADNVQSFGELSELVKELYPSDLLEKMDEVGANGVITRELYSRTREFEDALECALGFASNDKNF
jgi:inosine/xanthosine triphosphatase